MEWKTTLEIDIFFIIRVISVAFNLFIFGLWVKRKVVMDDFLVGRWEGSLRREDIFIEKPPKEDNPEDVTPTEDDREDAERYEIKCTLMMSKEKGKNDVGYIYYRKVDIEDDRKVMCLGLDKLEEYHGAFFFIFKRKWDPIFVRVFHKWRDGHSDTSKRVYKFECKVESIFLKPKLKVRVQHKDGTNWTGYWAKA